MIRSRNCIIGLGGNLGDPVANIQSALNRIGTLESVSLSGCSSLYRSPPWGRTDQPDFVNAVAAITTDLDPHVLLERLLSIETTMGRQRDGSNWAPRSIDLDLLLVDKLVLTTDVLEIPHSLMHLRAFVLVPLLELLPECSIPGKGRADLCLQRLGANEVGKIIAIGSPELPLPAGRDD